GWLRSVLTPLRNLWIWALPDHKNRRMIHVLYEDVRSCPCEDVQVLWSILV
ncbi:hypothetical protein M569_12279, partial [Genlisea aurea]